MRYTILLSVCFLAVIIFGCKEENDCTDDTTSVHFLENSALVNVSLDSTILNYTVIDGDNVVFILNHDGAQCNNVTDDEWGEHLKFEVTNGTDQFTFENDGLATAKCIYNQSGAWVPSTQQEITQGLIIGQQIDASTWDLNITVTLSTPNTQGDLQLTFSGLATLN